MKEHTTNAMKVSVIIPVYGVERYIERCVRSLFGQTMQDGIEFIFVNDCTPDRSIDIIHSLLDEYPHRRPQTRIIDHTENQGLAVARVTGVKAAQGEFVIHCDSDDWVEPDMYELLYNKAAETGADITGCDFFEELPDGTKYKQQRFDLPHDELLLQLTSAGTIEGFLWNRLVSRQFYLSGNYHAPKGTTLLEDLAVTLPMHIDTARVAYVAKALYHYNRTIADSMSSDMDLKKIRSAASVLSTLYDTVRPQSIKDRLAQRLVSYLVIPIIMPEHYNPDFWRQTFRPIAEIHKSHITFKRKISLWLVNHHCDHLNLLFVRLYADVFRRKSFILQHSPYHNE